MILIQFYFIDCLILYKGSNEKVSNLVREAVNNFNVLNKNKTKKDNDTIDISLVGIRPDVSYSKSISDFHKGVRLLKSTK